VTHLNYHARRYSRFAIGFHREAAVRHGFNPVFYTVEDAGIIEPIYEGFAALESMELGETIREAARLEADVRGIRVELEDRQWVAVLRDVENGISDLQSGVAQGLEAAIQGYEGFRKFLGFVKTFDATEFGTVYCEREWRALTTFKFSFEDVAMIVAPRALDERAYFEELLAATAQLNLPRAIPVVPWEDLIEH
jgi:hypothetical protein